MRSHLNLGLAQPLFGAVPQLLLEQKLHAQHRVLLEQGPRHLLVTAE